MTRIKTIMLTTLGWILLLGTLGIFVSVGLAMLGLFAVLGLGLAIAAGLGHAFGRTPEMQDARG